MHGEALLCLLKEKFELPHEMETIKLHLCKIARSFAAFFRAAPAAHGGFQARGLVGAVAD